MEKTVVLPYEVYNRLNHVNKYEYDHITVMENELHELMQNKSMSDSEKMVLYSQIIQKHTHRMRDTGVSSNNNNNNNNNSTQPSASPTYPSSGNSNNNHVSVNNNLHMLFNSTGPLVKKYATNLYNYLDKHTDINWSDNGEICLYGDVIP